MKEPTLNKRQRNITLASVIAVAGVLYALISLVNHYLFRTYALDLGLYNHFMYEYAHFRMPDLSLLDRAQASALSDHFDLYLMLLSPLVYVFGTYTLLVVQIAAVLLGGWGVYKLVGLYTDDGWMPLLAMAAFYFSFGVIHPFGFDYHSNVVTAMMLPWLLYYLKRKRFVWASLFVVLFVVGKENMSLWLFFIVIALMWDYRKDKQTLWHLVAYAVFSLAYFFIINMIVMPKLGGNGGGFDRYAYLGDNYVDIAKYLLMNPRETFRLLFVNTSGLPRFDGVKAEFYICALTTGLALTLLKPNYLIMLIPLIGQKMLSIDGMFWGISVQYSVEFMPVIVIASFLVIIRLKKQAWRMVLAGTLLLLVILTTFYTIGVPKAYASPEHICVYQDRHYKQSAFDVRYARELIRQIPDDASVCAASMFVPHLALRDHIGDFYYSRNMGADYVLITKPYFDHKVHGTLWFDNRDDFETVATDGTIYLLKRVAP